MLNDVFHLGGGSRGSGEWRSQIRLSLSLPNKLQGPSDLGVTPLSEVSDAPHHPDGSAAVR